MYADHALRLAQEVVTENFFLCLLRQTGKGGGKFRMIQNGGLVAGGKKIFFKLLRLGKLEKLFIHQISVFFEVNRLHLKDFLAQHFQLPQRFRQAIYFLLDSGSLFR